MPLKLEDIVDSSNIAADLSEKELDSIFANCEDGFKEDELSREEWETRQNKYMELALQVVEQKNTPWANASNVKYPLLTSATMQFGARAYPGLIPGPQVVKGRVSGFDPTGQKTKAAERIGKHMSYQLIEEMDEWESDMDKLCVSLPITGCMFKKTYFSPSKGKNVSELIYPKDLVVNYWTKTLKDAPRITHKILLSDNDIFERVAAGIFLDLDYNKERVEGDETSNEIHGTQEPPNSETTPHLFKEQHTWLDLDEDGYKEPYIVTFGDGEVARIVAGYDLEDIIYQQNKLVRIDRVEYFTKYGFVPNPDGSFYDIGFGLLLGPINDTINTTINQLIDAGTMAVRAGGFLGRGAKIKGGKHTFKPFEWQNVNSTGDDLRKSIVPLPVREPSSVLFSLLGMMIEAGKELSSTVPMIMGQNPGQNQPATTSMAVIEQGLKVYSAIFKRMHRSLKHELKKLKRLNKLYLPPQSYFQVLDPKPEKMMNPETGEEEVVTKGAEFIWQQDYETDETDVQPYSDPNIVAEVQRMIKAQQVSEMMAQGLIPNQQEAAKVVLEALDLPNIDKLLEQPPQQPNPEFELERIKAESESKYKHDRLQGELAVMDAQIIGLQAKASLDLAKAEEIGDKIQIEIYKTQLMEFDNRRQGIKDIMDQENIDKDRKQIEQPKPTES